MTTACPAHVGADAPPADRFPANPASWYLFGPAHDLRRRPVAKTILGRPIVAFRTASGKVVVMDGRCAHLGGDLGRGEVVGEAIRCPFHHWEYGANGRCQHIPAQAEIPAFARQTCYPAVERHGLLFFFNRPEALFALPFFPGCRPEDFCAARPFGTVLDCPWYMVGANAFDRQHFGAAHDRRLLGEPVIECPAPFARRATGTFRVASDSLQDRITRRFAGDEVTLAITDWCGNLMFATASFRRTTSYGMVVTEPLGGGRVRVQVVVYLPRSRRGLLRVLLDPLRLAVRRLFIMRFLSADAELLNGVRYNPDGLIAADGQLAEYFRWLAEVSHETPHYQTPGGPSDAATTDSQFAVPSGTECRSRST
jgi:phenylpropionate dioxygenase-like ring-hydroxylating dioxygenase large terminal subunit